MYVTMLSTYMKHGQLVDHQGPDIIDQRLGGSRCIRLNIGLRPLCCHSTHGLKEKRNDWGQPQVPLVRGSYQKCEQNNIFLFFCQLIQHTSYNPLMLVFFTRLKDPEEKFLKTKKEVVVENPTV